jgi:hypothetical protein
VKGDEIIIKPKKTARDFIGILGKSKAKNLPKDFKEIRKIAYKDFIGF